MNKASRMFFIAALLASGARANVASTDYVDRSISSLADRGNNIPSPPQSAGYVLTSTASGMEWRLPSSGGVSISAGCVGAALSKTGGSIAAVVNFGGKSDFAGKFAGTYASKGQGPYLISFDFATSGPAVSVSNLAVAGNVSAFGGGAVDWNGSSGTLSLAWDLALDSWAGTFYDIKVGGACVNASIS